MKKTIILALILTGFLLFLRPNLPKVSAITEEELQAQIQQLLQIIQQLQQQLNILTSGRPQPSSGLYCFSITLKYGMTSPEVKNLQIVLGVKPATGYFGDLTLAAVKNFQEKHNIEVTGEVGPQTREVLNSLYCAPSPSQCGWCGQDCIRKTPTMNCPDVMPPLGVECKEVNGVCTKIPLIPPTKYSCVTTLGTISANTYSTCVPNTNGTFNSLEECQKVCSEISFKCSSLSGKYSMTFTEAVQLFNNSECKSLGDPYKLPIYCQRCDPKTDHSKLYNAIYGEDTALLDDAAYRIGECIINVKNKTAYINRGPNFCTGATDAEGAWTIVCAMQNTPQEGWYSLEGIGGQVTEVKLSKLQECSNCQLTCSDTAAGATFTDSCTKTTVTSYGGEFRCKSIGVPPKNPTYIQELIKNYYSPTTTCTDSDGNNTFTKGTVTYQGKTYTDFCTSSTTVNEYVCGNEQVMSTNTRCSYKCEDGKCILPTQASCDATCKAKGYTSGTCKTWPVTPSVQWGCSQNETALGQDTADCYVEYGMLGVGKACCCASSVPPATCTDSDGGDNIYVKGYRKDWQDLVEWDYCILNPFIYPDGSVVSDQEKKVTECAGNNCYLIEYHCSNITGDAHKGYQCPSGYTCQDGACKISSSILSITINSNPPADSNGNVTIKQGDQITIIGVPSNLSGQMGVDYTRAFVFDSIFNNSCSNTDWVMTCTANQIGTSNFYIRLYKDGQTYQSNVIKVMVVASTPVTTIVPTCTDSDGGWNIYTKGITYINNTAVCVDRCATASDPQPDQLFECFCGDKKGSGGGQGSGWIVCPSGYTCQDGACKQSANSTSYLDSLKIQLPQLSDLIKKLSAALVQLSQKSQ